MERPCVSVVIPIKDRLDCLREAVDSVARQTLRDWECLLVDDGSSAEVIEFQHSTAERDPRFRVVDRSRGSTGANACRNAGLEAARSPWVIFLDSDDLLASFALEERFYLSQRLEKDRVLVRNAEAFENYPGDVGTLFNLPTQADNLDRFLEIDFPWQTSAPTWPRELLTDIGGFDESLPSWQDWELHVRALINGVDFSVRNEADYFIRLSHSSKLSRDQFSEVKHLRTAITLMSRVERQLEQSSLINDQRSSALEINRRRLMVRLEDISGFKEAYRALPLFPVFWKKGVRARLIASLGVGWLPAALRMHVRQSIWGSAINRENKRRLVFKAAVQELLASGRADGSAIYKPQLSDSEGK